MADDKTMRMVTNLDRKAIEGKLAETRSAAQSSNLAELGLDRLAIEVGHQLHGLVVFVAHPAPPGERC